MPMTEDLSVFFDASEHAHCAVLDHVEVTGVFDNGYAGAFDAGMSAAEPTFTLPSAACARVLDGSSRLRIAGAGDYIVRTAEPDGTGVTILRLTRDTRA